MVTDDIEIGIRIIPTLYLNIGGDFGNVPFDVNYITNVEPTENGSMVYVTEPEGPVGSRMVVNEYFVTNSYEKVMGALKDARFYKEEGLKRIQELLD